ncbi:MAG: S41 family peptidase [Bacteroidota bacterium]
MKQLIFIFLLVGYCQLSAQNIQKGAVLEDLNFLMDEIVKYNPALPIYHPEFKKLSTPVIESISSDSISIFDYFTKVSKICALANEGHFGLGDWQDIVHKGIPGNELAYLPLEIKLLSGKLYVSEDYSNERLLKKGDLIESINGIKTETIVKKLLELTPSDGNIETYAYRKIGDGFNWLYLFHIEQADTFEIVYFDQNALKKTVKIKALVRSDQVANYRKYYSDNNQQNSTAIDGFYDLLYDKDYAILTLPSFDFRRVNKYEVKSKKLYKAIFTELKEKQVNHLIIDLRDNTGGRNEFADNIIPFILKSSNGDSFIKKTISWEGKEKVYAMPKASKLAFTGTIYVLVNGKTFSAGSSLARFLKEYGDAIVIGTETGTRYDGFAAGSSQDVILPNSQIKIGIPRYHILFPPSKKQTKINRGLIPDYEITYTFKEYVDGSDLHLKKAISLIDDK